MAIVLKWIVHVDLMMVRCVAAAFCNLRRQVVHCKVLKNHVSILLCSFELNV